MTSALASAGASACGGDREPSPLLSGAPPRDTVELQLQLPDSARRAREDSLEALRRDSLAQAHADSMRHAAPGYVVDSARSLPEQLQRFRGSTPAVHSLAGGAPSRDSLVALVVSAVARHDVATLAALNVSRAEYAWLVYPELPIARPPYNHPPDAAWMLLAAESRSGRSKLVERFRNAPLVARGYACDAREQYGPVELWPNCRVKVQGSDGQVRAQRLFGAVVAVNGRFKLLSFGNDF